MDDWNDGFLTFRTEAYSFGVSIIWTLEEGIIEANNYWQATIAFGRDFPEPREDVIEHIFYATHQLTKTQIGLTVDGESPKNMNCYVTDIDDLFDSRVFKVSSRPEDRFVTQFR